MDNTYLSVSDGTGDASLMQITGTRTIGATTINVNTVTGVPAKFIATSGTLLASGFIDPTTKTDFFGHLNAGSLVIDGFSPGNTDKGNSIGQVVVIKPNTEWANLVALAAQAINPAGTIVQYAMKSAPVGWLSCDGSAVSRNTYALLFSALNPTIGVTTITIASPAVVTFTNHNLQTGSGIFFATTGVLPTGLSPNTKYFVIRIDANTFKVATSLANALAATAINTSGSQSGTHSLFESPWGVGDGSTTFNVPDMRGRIAVGRDSTQTEFAATGETGGEKTHTLTIAEMPNHAHALDSSRQTVVQGSGFSHVAGNGSWNFSSLEGTSGTTFVGGGGAHNNLQPYVTTNFIIKT